MECTKAAKRFQKVALSVMLAGAVVAGAACESVPAPAPITTVPVDATPPAVPTTTPAGTPAVVIPTPESSPAPTEPSAAPTQPSPVPTVPPTTVGPVPVPVPVPVPARRALGAWLGTSSPAEVQAYGQWAGHEMTQAHSFLYPKSWVDMKKGLTSQLSAWKGTSYDVLFSAPMLTDEGGSLQEGAAGAYDAHWVELGQMLVKGGRPNATLRLGYEFNLKWPRWSAQSDPAAFATYWRRIVTSMRSVPGAAFRFDWNPAFGVRVNLATYPGDAYVDFIGLDVYDQSYGETQVDPVRRWQRYLNAPMSGLLWQRDFALAHGKAMTYPEWAVSTGPHAVGADPDNPYFVQKMAEWIKSNNVEYALYFESNPRGTFHSLRTGPFPRAAAAFQEAFGS